MKKNITKALLLGFMMSVGVISAMDTENLISEVSEDSRPDAEVIHAIKTWPFGKKPKKEWLPEDQWREKSQKALEKILDTISISRGELLRDYVHNKGKYYDFVKKYVQDTGFISSLKSHMKNHEEKKQRKSVDMNNPNAPKKGPQKGDINFAAFEYADPKAMTKPNLRGRKH